LAITTTNAIVSGDLVFVAIGYNNTGGGVVSTVSDGTNTYSKAAGAKTGNGGNEIWYKENASAVGAGASLTVTMTNSTARLIIEAARVTGIQTSASLDKAVTGTTSAITGVLAQASELVVGTFGGFNVTAITESAGFTNLYSLQQSTSQVWENIAYKIAASTGSVTYQPTITGDSSAYVFAVASFKAALVTVGQTVTVGCSTTTSLSRHIIRSAIVNITVATTLSLKRAVQKTVAVSCHGAVVAGKALVRVISVVCGSSVSVLTTYMARVVIRKIRSFVSAYFGKGTISSR
jgi:hypothetical protein